MFDTRKHTCPHRKGRARRPPLLLLAVVTCTLWSVGAGASTGTFEEEEDAGRGILLAAKCQRCHAVSTAEVAMDEGSRVKGPDLAKLSAPMRQAEVLDAYLRRTETKNGKRHPFPWRGEDDELDRLIQWLLLHQAGDTAPDDTAPDDTEPGAAEHGRVDLEARWP